MQYLLDSNVISELWKPTPDAAVVEWLQSADWSIPVVVIAEIQEGAESAPSKARQIEINARLDEFLLECGGLVIDWDAETARIWARLQHSPEVKRKPQALWDSLIDAMAVRFRFVIASRNSKDFRHATVYDPWTGIQHSSEG